MAIGLRQLEAFRAVAECGSFTRASQTLFITQSTVSQHIHSLESELQTKLFERNRRNVVLSPAGERLRDHCRGIFQLLQEAEEAVRQEQDPFHGRVGFGCASSTLLFQMPQLLADYARRYPQVELRIVGGTVSEIMAQVESDALDLGLVVLPVNVGKVRLTQLWEESFVLALPADHRLAGQRQARVQQVRSERFILHMRSQNTRRLVERFLARQGVQPRLPIEIADTAVIKTMVAHGLGVAILPASAFLDGLAAGVRVFPIPRSQLSRRLATVHPKARPLRAPGRALAAMLQAHFQAALPAVVSQR